jgi:hypothetical protein
MKKLLALVAVSLLAINVQAFSVNQNSLGGLATVYGYLTGQEISLKAIESSYPELQQEVTLARLQFDASYSNAREKTKNKLIEIFKDNGIKLMAMTDEKLAEQPPKFLTKNEAVAFIKTVHNRANGIIENQPIRDFLLAITYFENPGLEIADKKVQKFNTKNEVKAKGLDINVTLPLSWKEQEGTTPNSIRLWKSEGGTGKSLITFLVYNSGDTRTKAQVKTAIERKELTNMVHPKATVNKIIYSEVSNQAGWYEESELVQQRLDLELYSKHKNIRVIYGGKTIEFGCGSGDVMANKEEVIKESKRVESLCRAVLLSLVLNNPYQ